MVNKFAEQITQNLKVGKKKRKLDDSNIEQDLSIHKNPSKKTRQNLKFEICKKSFTQEGSLKQHLHQFTKERHSDVTFAFHILH